jgi:hypothetical protein
LKARRPQVTCHSLWDSSAGACRPCRDRGHSTGFTTDLLGAYVDQETDLRGYVITGQSAFLAPLHRRPARHPRIVALMGSGNWSIRLPMMPKR